MSKKGQDNYFEDKDKKVRIKIIKDKCISAAVCIIQAPNTFDLDEDGMAYIKEGTVDEVQKIIKAAKACPTYAIIVEDLEGNQLFPVKKVS